jgi:hypothetical protein
MGKKIAVFALAFGTNYSSLIQAPLSQITQKLPAAVMELKNFVGSLQATIIAKVQEFNSPDGKVVVWKVVETTVFKGVYELVFKMMTSKVRYCPQ